MDRTDVRERYFAVRDAWRNYDFDLAIRNATLLLESQPDHVAGLRIRLKAALRLNDPKLVAKFALPVASVDISLAIASASKLARWGDLIAAAELYHAILVSPDLNSLASEIQVATRKSIDGHAAVLLARGDKANDIGDTSAALRLWHLGLRLAPTHSGLRQRTKRASESLAEVARKVDAQDPVLSVAAWRRVLEADPLHPVAFKNLALGSEAQGDYRGAITYWTALLQIENEQEQAASRLVRAAIKADCEFDVLKLLYAAGQIALVDPDLTHRTSRHLLHAAKVFLQQDDAQSAAPLLNLLQGVGLADEKLPAAVQKCVKLLSRTMSTARRSKDWDTAAVLARHLIPFEPANRNALEVLGRDAYRQRAFSDAAGFFRQLVRAVPGDQKGWRWLAEALRKSGDQVGSLQAIQHYETLQLSPGVGGPS